VTGRRAWTAILCGLPLACSPAARRSSPAPPANVCPDHPCSLYDGPQASCTAGVCTVGGPAPADLVLTIGLPGDSYFGPSRTFAVPLGAAGVCASGPCVRLAPASNITGSYVFQNRDLTLVGSTLVPSSPTGLTTIPVHATYRALWPPDAGSSADDAFTAGLPIEPVEAPTTVLAGGVPGPGGGPEVGFQTYVQPGIAFERTITADSPYDQEIPPAVAIVRSPDSTTENVAADPLDTTQEGATLQIPTYDLSLTQGTFDGWTAYLRDTTTKRPISPVKPLTGTQTPDGGLRLPTKHNPIDALTNAELVMAPPPDSGLPVEVSKFPNVFRLTYAELPRPVRVDVAAFAAPDAGQPVAADVSFEAVLVYVATGPSPPADAGTADASPPPTYVAQPNFEFVTQSTATAASAASVRVPRGVYRIVVRPRAAQGVDGSPAAAGALAVIDGFDTGDGTDAGPDAGLGPVSVATRPAAHVQGTVRVADGRLLSQATVEALPVHCAAPSGDGGVAPEDSARCMPRYAQTSTNPDGTYALDLDPGSYVLRVEPADGTFLPWVRQSVDVEGAAEVDFKVPAPRHLQLQLTDTTGVVPVAGAVVRLFSPPAKAMAATPGMPSMPATPAMPAMPAIEVGRTMTDPSGRLDLYVDPSLP